MPENTGFKSHLGQVTFGSVKAEFKQKWATIRNIIIAIQRMVHRRLDLKITVQNTKSVKKTCAIFRMEWKPRYQRCQSIELCLKMVVTIITTCTCFYNYKSLSTAIFNLNYIIWPRVLRARVKNYSQMIANRHNQVNSQTCERSRYALNAFDIGLSV